MAPRVPARGRGGVVAPSWRERLAAGQQKNPNGCSVWTRARNSRGYGVIYMHGKVRLAHRVAFYEQRGRWPREDAVIDHTCNNKPCVNPAHLRELENWQNLRRAHPVGTAKQERRREAWRGASARYRGNYSPTYNPKRGESD